MNIFSKALLMESKKIAFYTLNVSLTPSSATCTLTYNGVAHIETSATVPAGTIISYSIYHSTYGTQTGTITMDSDKTLTANGTYSTTTVGQSWSRPDLSANGTLGGSSFAVYASSEYSSSSYPIWKAFDSSSSTQWLGNANSTPISVIFYNYDPLKVSSLTITNRSNSKGHFSSGSVQGSNSNSGYTTLKSWTNSTDTSGGTWTISVNSSSFYKYHKIVFSTWSASSSSTQPGSANIGISAQKGVTSYTYYWNITVT